MNLIELYPKMLEIASVCLGDLDIDQLLGWKDVTIQKSASQSMSHKEPNFKCQL